VVLALVPVSRGVRRMLVVDEGLPKDEAEDRRKLGEAIAEGFEEAYAECWQTGDELPVFLAGGANWRNFLPIGSQR
jgi:hypothetical protein